MIRMAEMMKAASVADSASTLTNDSGEKVLSMAEKAAAKKAQRRAEAAAKKDAKPAEDEADVVDVAKELAAGRDRPALNDAQKLNAAARMATGVLASEKRARDVKIVGFSLSLHSAILVEDTTIELNWGQRYGLIGRNGCGKSTFLQCVAAREVPIPEHIDTYLLAEEAKPSEATALEYVISRCVAGRGGAGARLACAQRTRRARRRRHFLSMHGFHTTRC
jgi:ATP-binding cassette subfamily F protein 2